MSSILDYTQTIFNAFTLLDSLFRLVPKVQCVLSFEQDFHIRRRRLTREALELDEVLVSLSPMDLYDHSTRESIHNIFDTFEKATQILSQYDSAYAPPLTGDLPTALRADILTFSRTICEDLKARVRAPALNVTVFGKLAWVTFRQNELIHITKSIEADISYLEKIFHAEDQAPRRIQLAQTESAPAVRVENDTSGMPKTQDSSDNRTVFPGAPNLQSEIQIIGNTDIGTNNTFGDSWYGRAATATATLRHRTNIKRNKGYGKAGKFGSIRNSHPDA